MQCRFMTTEIREAMSSFAPLRELATIHRINGGRV
jgi:hypothetical protein